MIETTISFVHLNCKYLEVVTILIFHCIQRSLLLDHIPPDSGEGTPANPFSGISFWLTFRNISCVGRKNQYSFRTQISKAEPPNVLIFRNRKSVSYCEQQSSADLGQSSYFEFMTLGVFEIIKNIHDHETMRGSKSKPLASKVLAKARGYVWPNPPRCLLAPPALPPEKLLYKAY